MEKRPKRNLEGSQEPWIFCKLGRHLPELSIPCLFANVFACCKQGVWQQAGHSLCLCRAGDAKGARSGGKSAIRATIPGAQETRRAS